MVDRGGMIKERSLYIFKTYAAGLCLIDEFNTNYNWYHKLKMLSRCFFDNLRLTTHNTAIYEISSKSFFVLKDESLRNIEVTCG